MIRVEIDYRAHLGYSHYTPVKHGWVKQVIDWLCPKATVVWDGYEFELWGRTLIQRNA
ncbi:MAG: hypothetical protein WC782_10625 [Methylococcaceae bacterium]